MQQERPSGTAVPRIEIGIDTVDPEALAPFWSEALGYSVGELDRDGTYLDLVPPADPAAQDGGTAASGQLARTGAKPGRPVVYFQRVPEAKLGKNRLHLDLMVADPQALIARLIEVGGRTLGGPKTGSAGGWWQVMADPEGNELCICLEYEDCARA